MNLRRLVVLLALLAAVIPLSRAAPAGRMRDPFLPVNFTPPNPVPGTGPADGGNIPPEATEPAGSVTNAVPPAPAVPDWAAARKQLVIGGVTRFRRPGADKDAYAALVNGRLVEAGDVVSVVIGGFKYQWRVVEIGPKGISFSPVDEGQPAP